MQANKRDDRGSLSEYRPDDFKHAYVGDISNSIPNETSVFIEVFANSYNSSFVLPTVPKVLSLRTRGMDETNSIKKKRDGSDSHDEKIKPGMSDSLKEPAAKNGNTACPFTCKCKWKQGKETVECASKGFKNIPYIKDSGTQVGDLNNVSLYHISVTV